MILKLNILNSELKNYNNQSIYDEKEFIKFPEIENYYIKGEKLFSENIVENNYVFSNKKSKFDWSNYDGIRTEVTEVNFEEFEKKIFKKMK